MKKVLYMFALGLYVIRVIGGVGHTLYIHEYVTAVGVSVLACMAWPTAVNFWKYVNG